MKNLFTENRLVFMSGPETSGRAEQMSSHEIKRLNGKLNKITKKFDKIRAGHVKAVMKNMLKENLKDSVIKALKKKLDPYNPKKADQLFSIMYPPSKLKQILQKTAQKLKRVKINVSSQNVNSIRFGSKSKFAYLITQECGVKDSSSEPSISTGNDRPWKNLGSKLASKTSPSKLRAAVKKSSTLAKKAVSKATKDEIGQKTAAQIRNIVRSVA